MDRLKTFQGALNLAYGLSTKHPEYFVLKGIIAQLEYLIAILNGSECDYSKLNTIILGRMTAYDIEGLDQPLSDLLYLAAEEARQMKFEYTSK